MGTTDNSKALRKDRIRTVLAGATKNLQPNASFTLVNSSYTLATLTQFCQTDIAASDAATAAKASWLATVQTERETNTKTDAVLRAFKGYVLSLYGDSPTAGNTLADFGYTPRKPRSKNVATKATAADKLRATRAARGTLGPKEKLKITGTLPASAKPVAPATTVTPVAAVAPGSPATPVAPATTVTPVAAVAPVTPAPASPVVPPRTVTP